MDGLIRTPLGHYVLRDDTCLSRTIEQEQRLDVAVNLAELAQIAPFLPEGGVVIEAGACLGDHPILYSQVVGASGMVHAFEPHPLTYQALCRNVARFTNIQVYPVALGAVRETRVLAGLPNAGASFVAPADTNAVLVMPAAGGPSQLCPVWEVECETLDDIFSPALTRCDLIHLDAEGCETQILAGGARLIARCHPVLVLEVCHQHLERGGSTETDLLALVDRWGYQVQPLTGVEHPGLRNVLAVWDAA